MSPFSTRTFFPFDVLERLAEHHLREAHHLLREGMLGAVLLGDHVLPILDEAVGHLATEQDGVARVGQVVDEGLELWPHLECHPVELTLWPRHVTVDRDLHLRLQLSHDFLSLARPEWTAPNASPGSRPTCRSRQRTGLDGVRPRDGSFGDHIGVFCNDLDLRGECRSKRDST
jgi:hypothetical protein